MLRKHHRFFQSLRIARDAALAGLAFYLAYICRFAFPAVLPYHTVSSMHETLAVGLMLVLIWPLVGYAGGLYVSRRARTMMSDLFDLFKTTGIAFVLLVTLTYFARDARYSRAVLILWAVFCLGLGTVAQLGGKLMLRRLRARGYNLRHVLLVGSAQQCQRVREAVSRQAGLGLRLVDQIELNLPAPAEPGDLAALAAALQGRRIDQVIIALPIEQLGHLRGIMDVLSRETVDVRLVPDFYQVMTLCGSVEELCGLPIINLQSTPLLGWSLVLKRGFDVLAASLGLLVVAPVLALIAAAIALGSPGPIFYRQRRVGMDGREFAMIKFRTMRANAEAQGARMAVHSDPRCTALGSLLRRLSLDELPQLFNVLRGDMSLVGPRPERPCFIADFKQQIPRYALRHKIKAGMTGWAQVHGMRGNTSIAKRIELDLYYIENWSLLLDLKILLRTVLGGFLSPHAY